LDLFCFIGLRTLLLPGSTRLVVCVLKSPQEDQFEAYGFLLGNSAIGKQPDNSFIFNLNALCLCHSVLLIIEISAVSAGIGKENLSALHFQHAVLAT
jgi:hypothetical protein